MLSASLPSLKKISYQYGREFLSNQPSRDEKPVDVFWDAKYPLGTGEITVRAKNYLGFKSPGSDYSDLRHLMAFLPDQSLKDIFGRTSKLVGKLSGHTTVSNPKASLAPDESVQELIDHISTYHAGFHNPYVIHSYPQSFEGPHHLAGAIVNDSKPIVEFQIWLNPKYSSKDSSSVTCSHAVLKLSDSKKGLDASERAGSLFKKLLNKNFLAAFSASVNALLSESKSESAAQVFGKLSGIIRTHINAVKWPQDYTARLEWETIAMA